MQILKHLMLHISWVTLLAILFCFLTFSVCQPESPSAKNSSDFIKRFSIGQTVTKQPIWVYQFGQGNKKVLLMGLIHGDETPSIKFLERLLLLYRQGSYKLPKQITLFVIPNSNPDGYRFMTRFNANGVDLNRNFPTENWQSKTYVTRHSIPGGGGQSPASEPETRALMGFIKENKPYLTITYHSQAGYLYPEINDDVSIQLARKYSKASGIPSLEVDWSQSYYNVTGSFAQWLTNYQHLHTILVEHENKFTIDNAEINAHLYGVTSVLEDIAKLP